jgi:hypothetical protein
MIIAQLVKKFPAFMEAKQSLLYLYEPVNRPYPDPHESSQHTSSSHMALQPHIGPWPPLYEVP